MVKVKKGICLVVALLFLFSTTLTGCGNTKSIDGKEYDTYGLLNRDTKKNNNIEYEVIIGNLILGILFVETIIAPIYFFGFDLFQPIGKKGNIEKGVINK